MDHVPAPRAHHALRELKTHAAEPDADPSVIDAARVLAALCEAARLIGGEDVHVEHWLTNTAGLSRPSGILGTRRIDGRPAAADLDAYERGSAQDRRVINEILTAFMDAQTPG